MTAAAVRAPLVDGTTWLIVVQRAGYRCQCRGECGSVHTKGDGRCPHEAPAHELDATARDATATDYQACRAHVDELVARCASCVDGARRLAGRDQLDEHGGQVAGQLDLVDLLGELGGWSA